MPVTTDPGQSRTRIKAYPEEPRTILIADDEHLVSKGIATLLEKLGMTVVGPAADGDQAIALCRSERPDMALLDIRMPRRDGLAAAEVIFGQFGIPVVIFSAYSDGSYVDAAGSRLGIFGYMLKPVTRDQLRVTLAVAWRRFLDHVQQTAEIDDLKHRLESRKAIEQAKWVLVERRGVSEPEAMRMLQRQARNNRRPLVEVARSILENAELLVAKD